MLALPPYREPDYLDLTGLREEENKQREWQYKAAEMLSIFDDLILGTKLQNIKEMESIRSWSNIFSV